jgi:hypothetical protein
LKKKDYNYAITDSPPLSVIQHIIVTLASWEYPVDFLVIYSKSSSKPGHPVVLGHPWLATTDAFISCRSGEMTISNGTHSQNLVLFPPAQPAQEIPIWLEKPYGEEDCIKPLLILEQVRGMQEQSDEQVLSLFLVNTNCIEYPRSFVELSHIFSFEFQQTWHLDITQLYSLSPAHSEKEESIELVEISPGKPLYINSSLELEQKTQVIEMLQRQFDAFAWDYADMKGIHPDTCTHHIYTNDQIILVRQPQRRMNPALKDIVKEELQKLLQANLIYPISDSQWVSPLVIVPKKNGKWRICIYFRELNKATHTDYFPLPFIDLVLDTLSRKKYFLFLDGFSGYNQIQIAPKDQEKTTFTCPWGTYAYKVLPFGFFNAPYTFQRVVLAIFSNLTNDCMEVYMDDFTVHGKDFQEALTSLEKVLIRCKETNLSLSNEKSKMMFTKGIVLGHHISGYRMRVDLEKIHIITQIIIPSSQKEVCIFLGHDGYYRRFIPNFTSLATPLFKLLSKEDEFKWDDECQISFEILLDHVVIDANGLID